MNSGPTQCHLKALRNYYLALFNNKRKVESFTPKTIHPFLWRSIRR